MLAEEALAAKKAAEGGRQTGAFLNGKLYYLGEVLFKNGDTYKGNFKDGRPCG